MFGVMKSSIYICVFYNTSKHLEKYTTKHIEDNFVMMFGANKYILTLNNLKGTLVDSI
jgi:hypothetical protein